MLKVFIVLKCSLTSNHVDFIIIVLSSFQIEVFLFEWKHYFIDKKKKKGVFEKNKLS